jgi:phage baseplate assembly protein W
MQFNYPFRISDKGLTATVNEEEHIRQLIEQVLFTAQGERVNRPSFGSGINQLIFAPNSDVLATTTQILVQGALQQWLGSLIKVESVKVQSEESTLQVEVQYTVRLSQQHQVANFTRQQT